MHLLLLMILELALNLSIVHVMLTSFAACLTVEEHAT